MRGPVLVTGGSGFVGGALLRRLLAGGLQVRALARSAGSAAALEAAGARPVPGDVLDPAAMTEAMRGCSIAFHVAGVNAMCRRDPSEMYRVNVAGAENAARAAARAGVERLVVTSSAAAIGEVTGTIGREDSPHRGRFLSHYERSKHLGELRAFEASSELGLEMVALNPASVQGPGRTGGTGRLMLAAARGRMPAIVHTQVSLVDVQDCAEGHVRAAEKGVPGERYLLCGSSLPARDLDELIRRATGRRGRAVPVPRAVVSLAGAIAGPLSRAAGRDLPFCGELARTLLHGHRYDGSRAERDLDLRYTPIEETLDRTIRWYLDHGLLRARAGRTPAT
ncbi:MAG: NAD-dependent epimerase/dehydratase family protein [Actinobacteria bacterium]|nr:NAD-dependent epimerase/dehydratase family protein [Actinomycetota bacterium]